MEIDEKRLRALLGKGLSQREIAKQMGTSRSTLQRAIHRLEQAPSPLSTPVVTKGIPEPMALGLPPVNTGTLSPEDMERVRADFWEMVTWWRERKLRRVNQDQPGDTQRATFHVERRWLTRIHQEAETEGATIATIVNRAFRQFFEGK
jgi:transcriptional regulator with XRE-family HTH domain